MIQILVVIYNLFNKNIHISFQYLLVDSKRYLSPPYRKIQRGSPGAALLLSSDLRSEFGEYWWLADPPVIYRPEFSWGKPGGPGGGKWATVDFHEDISLWDFRKIIKVTCETATKSRKSSRLFVQISYPGKTAQSRMQCTMAPDVKYSRSSTKSNVESQNH